MPCNASYTRFIFLKGFSYVLQIDLHLIGTPMVAKFYSCKKWVLHKVTASRIQDNFRARQSCQESYANKGHGSLGVWSWRSCLSKSFTHEGHEEVWNEKEVGTSLHWTVSYTWEVLKYSIQVGIAIIIGKSSRYLPRITAKEVLEGTHRCRITWCDTARGWLDVPWASNKNPRSKGSCHEVQDD
jgi:hypothetical protein